MQTFAMHTQNHIQKKKREKGRKKKQEKKKKTFCIALQLDCGGSAGNLDCEADVTAAVAQSCDGQSSCNLRAKNDDYGDPCYGTTKYLQVSYYCDGR